MNKEQFIENVKKDVLELLDVDQDAEVVVQDFYKTNDVKLAGLRVQAEDLHISPNLYLDSYFNDYSKGSSYEEVLNHIASDFNSALEAGRYLEPVKMDLSFDSIKDKLNVQIIDMALNKNRLQNMAYTNMGEGFVATYRIIVKETPDGFSSIPITNKFLKTINKSVEEIHNIAFENMERDKPATFVDMDSQMFSLMTGVPVEAAQLTPDMNITPDGSIYLVSNGRDRDGSVAFWYKDTKKTIGEVLGDDFYALPSSLHEILIVPKSSGMTAKELQKMVAEVNSTVVHPDDRLSNKVLSYNRATDRLQIAAGHERNREEAR